MVKALGIWIDHREAKLFDVTNREGEAPARRIESEVEELRKTTTGHVANLPPKAAPPRKGVHSFGSHEAKHAEHRVEHELKEFYGEVAAMAKGADRIAIVGPGRAHEEFARHLQAYAPEVWSHVDFIESIDTHLTDGEIVRELRTILGRPPRRGPVWA